MFRSYHNGHFQASMLGGVVNTIVIRNIRDLVSCAKLAVYYHILVGVIVVNSTCCHDATPTLPTKHINP
jgi:hypothetical protein